MATRKYKFKHIAASSGSYVGDAGELILDTSTNTLKVSDGSTAGGVTLTTDGTGGGGGSTGDIGFSGNRLKTSSSNADLELDANGTGSVVVMSPTFTIKDENFAGSPTIRDFTNDAFDMYNTLNINKKPSGSEGIRVDTYNAGYNVKSTTNSGSSTITNFKFNFAELTNGTEAERVGTLRFDSGIDNGGSLSQSVNMDFIPTNSGESGNNYYSFREDGLYLGSNVANIKNFGSPGYIGFDWIRVDGVDIKDNIITTNSSNADLQLDANGTGKITTTAQLQPYRFLVPRFATESAANSAYGTKVGGELIYTTGDNQLRVWNGSVWSSVM